MEASEWRTATSSFSAAWMRPVSSRACSSASAVRAWASAAARARGQELGLELLDLQAHLAHLAPRGQQALDRAAALHQRAAQGLALQRHAGHGAVGGLQRQRVVEGLDHQRVGQGRADLGLPRARDAVERRQQALDPLRLAGRGVLERGAAVAGAGRGERQERAAAGLRLLQQAHPCQGLLGARHQHRLQAVAQERLHRALVGRVGLEGVGQHAQHFEASRALQQGPHALVEGAVVGHHLLERGQAAGQAVALALAGLGGAAGGLGLGARRGGALLGLLALLLQRAQQRLALRAAGLALGPLGLGPAALALQLLGLGGQLEQVSRGPLGVAADRLAGVGQGREAVRHGHLRVAGRVLLLLAAGLGLGRRLHAGLGRAGLGRGGLQVGAQLLRLGRAGGQALAQRPQARLQLGRLVAGLGRARVGLRDLLAAVAALALVAVDRQGQLVEPRAHLLEARLLLVEAARRRASIWASSASSAALTSCSRCCSADRRSSSPCESARRSTKRRP